MLLTLIKIIVVVAVLGFLFVTSYVKAPPDTAFVISGLRKRVIVGRAGLRIPFLERVDKLSLKMMSVDVKTSEPVPTNNFIDVFADSAVKIKIGSDDESIALAAENFLNMKGEDISNTIKDVLEGNLREIIGSLDIREMIQDRKSFATKVQENAVPDLKRMGLEIISFNVQAIKDQSGIILSLGSEQEADIKKTTSIRKAEAEKEVAIYESGAQKLANDARIASDLEIAQKNNELEIKKAELKRESDIRRAQADASYRIEEEEQRKQIETKTQEANIIKQVKEIELAEKEVLVRQQKLEAEVNKQADADLYAKQKEAEAQLYIAEKEAEAAKVSAEADRYVREQEAMAIRANGLAEADAIKAKGLAEAEAINAKADAMQKYGDAAMAEMYFNILPSVAEKVAGPLANVDRITMYGDGNSSKMVKDIVNTMSQITDGISESTGLNIQSLIGGFMGGKMATPDVPKDVPFDESKMFKNIMGALNADKETPTTIETSQEIIDQD